MSAEDTKPADAQDFWLNNLHDADAFSRWTYGRLEGWLGQRVLELGCGIGTFTQLLGQNGRTVLAADLNAAYIETAARKLRGQTNVRFICADATKLELSPDERPDTVVMLDVLEHIADDRTMLRRIHAILKPGDRLVLKIPAHSWLYGQMDQAIGHHRRYNRCGLELLLGESGYTPLHLEYFNAVGIAGWWLNGRLLRRSTPPAQQVALFSALVPVIRMFDIFFSRIAGLSLIAVATPSDP